MSPPAPMITVVGAGRAGGALTAALAATGWRVRLVCRRASAAARLRSRFAAWRLDVTVTERLAAVDRDNPLVFATADRDLREAAEAAATALGVCAGPWLHLSGVSSPELLRVAGAGAPVGSCHPLAAIVGPHAAEDLAACVAPLRGALFALAGDAEAVALGGAIAAACGGQPSVVPLDGRSRYHGAASVVANDFVALLEIAERLCADAGLPQASTRPALLHLARTALDAIEAASARPGASLADGLTGAVGRGDAETIAAHLQALSPHPPGRRAHAALSEVLLGMVGGRLSNERVTAMRAALAESKDPP